MGPDHPINDLRESVQQAVPGFSFQKSSESADIVVANVTAGSDAERAGMEVWPFPLRVTFFCFPKRRVSLVVHRVLSRVDLAVVSVQ